MTDDPERAEAPAPAEPARRLTLLEQAEYLSGLVRRTRMANGKPSGEAWLHLTAEDVAILEQVDATLRTLVFYRADEYVRRQAREASARKRK